MTNITIQVPDDIFAALRRSPHEFAREIRVAAAIHWYSQALVSQGKAAEIAGLSRTEFLDELFRARVPACQYTVDEMREELNAWPVSSEGSSTPRP